jgi:hypothetical protein
MTAHIVDLTERREIRRLSIEIDELLERVRRTSFESDSALRQAVVNMQVIQLERQHAFLLAKLRPVLAEILELHALNFDAGHDKVESAINIASATSMLLDDQYLIGDMPARLEKRRAEQFAAYQALLREWGGELFKTLETDNK